MALSTYNPMRDALPTQTPETDEERRKRLALEALAQYPWYKELLTNVPTSDVITSEQISIPTPQTLKPSEYKIGPASPAALATDWRSKALTQFDPLSRMYQTAVKGMELAGIDSSGALQFGGAGPIKKVGQVVGKEVVKGITKKAAKQVGKEAPALAAPGVPKISGGQPPLIPPSSLPPVSSSEAEKNYLQEALKAVNKAKQTQGAHEALIQQERGIRAKLSNNLLQNNTGVDAFNLALEASEGKFPSIPVKVISSPAVNSIAEMLRVAPETGLFDKFKAFKALTKFAAGNPTQDRAFKSEWQELEKFVKQQLFGTSATSEGKGLLTFAPTGKLGLQKSGQQLRLGETAWTPKPLTKDLRTKAQRELDLQQFKVELANDPRTVTPINIPSEPALKQPQASFFPEKFVSTSVAETRTPEQLKLAKNLLELENYQLTHKGRTVTQVTMEYIKNFIEEAKQPFLIPPPTPSKIISWLKEAGWTIEDIGNAMRANVASADFSWWRQQSPLILNNAKEFTKANIAAWRATWDNNFAKKSFERITTDGKYSILYDKLGLDFLRPLEQKGIPFYKREEQFAVLGSNRPIPKFVEKLPWVRLSQRGFVTGTNEMNWGIWKKYVDNVEKINQKIASGVLPKPKGEKVFDVEKNLKALGAMLEAMTGRTQLGKAAVFSEAINAGFFAMRLNLGRVMTPTYLFSSNPLVRKEAWKNIITWVGGVGGVLLLGKQMGLWEVETRSNSSDFMKIRIGGTRIDPWGGEQQYVVFLAKALTNEAISPKTGKKQPSTILDTSSQFIRGKLSPLTGMLMDFKVGKTFLGEKVELSNFKQWVDRFAPMSEMSMYDALREEGLGAAALNSLSLFGAGTATYAYPKKGGIIGEQQNKGMTIDEYKKMRGIK